MVIIHHLILDNGAQRSKYPGRHGLIPWGFITESIRREKERERLSDSDKARQKNRTKNGSLNEETNGGATCSAEDLKNSHSKQHELELLRTDVVQWYRELKHDGLHADERQAIAQVLLYADHPLVYYDSTSVFDCVAFLAPRNVGCRKTACASFPRWWYTVNSISRSHPLLLFEAWFKSPREGSIRSQQPDLVRRYCTVEVKKTGATFFIFCVSFRPDNTGPALSNFISF